MSVTGVSSSNFFQSNLAQGAQSKLQQIQSQFQQLGQDLQAGNLTQAQSDFATLTQELPASQQQTGAATSTNSVAQAFKTLGQDLQSGNISAAQQDFAAIQQNAQQASGAGHGHHNHHRRAINDSSQQGNNTLSQAFGALGQALQSGNLSSAQQAYATLQQDLQQYLPSSSSGTTGSTSATGTTPQATGGTVSVNA
jgi:protein subunit release factor A